MAYIHDIAVTTQSSTTAATYAMNMPDHASGDLLVWYASADAGTLTPSGSTWTIIGSNPTSTTTNIIVSAAGYMQATTSTETLSLATSDVASCIVVCFKEVDATTPFDGVAIDFTAVNTATTTPVSVSRTSTTANALYVSMIASAGANPMAVSGPGAMWAAISDAGGTTDTLSAHNAIAWSYKRTAGATPVINWVNNLSMQYTRLSFVLRAASGARIPPYIDGVALSPAKLVHLGSYTGALNGTNTTTNGITANIAGKTGGTPAAAALLADSGLDPYTSILTTATAATAATALVGTEITITTAENVTGKLLAGAVMAGNWKQAMFGVGTVKQGGVVMRLGSGGAATTAWNAYQVSAKDAQVPPATPAVFVIEPGYATTAYASGTTNCDITAVKYVQIYRNAPSFTSQVGLTECWIIDKQVVAGGDGTYPVTLDGLVAVGKSFRLPLCQKAGASAVVLFAPFQIGGGDAVNFNVDSGVIQFPRRASATLKDLQYHASDNKLGLYDACKSGDTFKLTNSVVTTPNAQIYEITSAATSAATRDYTGTTFIGMTVTLRNVTTFSGNTFQGCPSVTFANACTVDGAAFKAVPTVTQGGSTITNSTFLNTKVVSASPTDAARISSSAFTKNTGTQHGLEIGSATAVPGSPASITLTGVSATGYAAYSAGGTSTGNEFLNILYTSGTLTINADALISYKTAGATVNIVTGQRTLTLTGLVAGSDVVIKTSDTNTKLVDVDANAPTTYAYTYSYVASTYVDISINKAGYVPYVVYDFLLANANAELPIAQVIDRNYQ